MAEFTKEQLVGWANILIEETHTDISISRTDAHAESYRAQLALFEIALAALTAPQLPQPAVYELTAETLTDEIKQRPAATAFVWMDGWNKACRTTMLQGKAEPKLPDAIDTNLIEALRLVQCMLEDYRERNYGDAERWIRHINTHMSDYSESHGDDAYSVLHDLLPAAPRQEVK